MRWRLCIDRPGWWLVKPGEDGLFDQLVYGPFTREEAQLAGEIHGVPFREGE